MRQLDFGCLGPLLGGILGVCFAIYAGSFFATNIIGMSIIVFGGIIAFVLSYIFIFSFIQVVGYFELGLREWCYNACQMDKRRRLLKTANIILACLWLIFFMLGIALASYMTDLCLELLRLWLFAGP